MSNSDLRRVAGIDCGTNSIRLLIADIDPATEVLTDVERRMEIVRLGQGVDRTGIIAPEAMARTLAVTKEYGAMCQEYGVEAIRFVATSASRDASNGPEFTSGVEAILGVVPEIVGGVEEARLSFSGALSGLDASHEPPYLIVDLGGGSTELVLGDSEPNFVFSMDVGCVRMAERHLRSDPPTPEQVLAAVADIDHALDEAGKVIPFERTRTLVGLAGTITTVTAHALGLERYDRDAIDGAQLEVDAILASCGQLLHSSKQEREAMGFIHPGRVDVIAAGALVWSRVVARVAGETRLSRHALAKVVTSEHDILDGVALSASRS